MGKKGDLSDYEHGMVVGAVFQKLLIYWDFPAQPSQGVTEKISSEQQFSGWKCLVDARGQRRMARLLWADRKAIVTQRPTHYNQGMQKHISEHTTRQTLKQMDYSSRRPHRVPHLSAKNRKLRLQFTQAQQKIGKTLPGLMSLDFCCDIRMVGSEFGVNNMTAWIHPALYQYFLGTLWAP